MKAVVQQGYGSVGRLRLEEVTVPEPAAGEVLLRVTRAALHIGDVHLLTGRPLVMRAMGFGLRAPKNRPGMEVAGTVQALGSGVTEFEIGDAVFGIGRGAFAQICIAPVPKLVRRPDELGVDQAVALPISGIAALQALRDAGRVLPGQRVLVIGAGGAVGRYCVQLARNVGANVCGLCSAAKADVVSQLGADEVLDYRSTDAFDGSRRFDLIVDTAGHRTLKELRRALTDTGTLVIVGSETDGALLGGTERALHAALLSPLIRQRLVGMVSKERASDIAVMRDLTVSGVVTPIIDRTFPLSEVPDAFRYLQSGRATGKVLVTP